MHTRLVPLDRVVNFRDFGGYDTPQGPVARGVLFRSASFHEATDSDAARLDALGVRFLVDLRRPEERGFEPNRWPGEACRVHFSDDGAPASFALPPHLVALLQSDLSPASVETYMKSLYREIPFDPRLIKLYRTWFAELSEGGTGVIHCAAGKDRTGIGCALTLLALGVSEADVFADYAFSNQAIDLEARLPRIQARMEERLARKLDPESLRPMLGVNEDYLREAFDAISAKQGSVEAYLEQVLHVGPTQLATLRARLV